MVVVDEEEPRDRGDGVRLERRHSSLGLLRTTTASRLYPQHANDPPLDIYGVSRAEPTSPPTTTVRGSSSFLYLRKDVSTLGRTPEQIGSRTEKVEALPRGEWSEGSLFDFRQ